MGSLLGLVLTGWLGCSGIQRIPGPTPPESVLPPSQARAHYLRGTLMAAKGDLDAAEAALERARVFDPTSPQILMALAQVALTRGDTTQARSRMADAAHIAPDNPEPWLAYGRLELAFGDAQLGRSALQRSLKLNGPWEARAGLIADALRRKQPSPLLDEWASLKVTDPIELRRRADLRGAAGDNEGAVRDYLAALQVSSRDLSLVAPLVRSATQGSYLAAGILGAEAICREQPAASAAWMAVGLLSSLIGDHGATIRGLETAAALGVELGDGPARTLARAQAAQETPIVSPSGRAPLLDDPINRALRLVQEQQWEAGEATLNRSLASFPNDPRLLYILSELHLKRDGAEAAAPHIEKVLSLQPGYGPALNMWAWIQAEQGTNLDEAELRVLLALERQPRVGSYWDTLGWILHQKGLHTQAQASLSRAHRLSPEDDTILTHLEACASETEAPSP